MCWAACAWGCSRAGWRAARSPAFWSGEHWRLLLAVGVLGGYTTFSSFALEAALFVDRGQAGLAALYLGVTLAAGIGALFLGLYAMRLLG
jgi:CrcB protein